MTEVRRETDRLGVVEVPADKLWGAQTQARWSISALARI
jgi:fumarate hydratase class II